MNHNRRSTDRRQGKNGRNSNGWVGPERRGSGRPPAWEMSVLPLESRILYTAVQPIVQQPDIDMPYVFDQAATNETLDAQAGATGGTKVPVSGGVPILHSHPSATAKIIIDFDGDGAYQWGNYNVPATPAYDQDGDPTTFNTAELASINEIWQRVSEKYSPFNIDVTTEDTGTYLNRTAVKVVVGGNGAWLGSVAGGIAFVGSFYNATDNIAYVFPANLSNGYAKYVGEAVSHEAGHTFGLQHQGQYNGTTLVQEYNPGNSLIAPIMGNSYYAARGLWWTGTPSNNASATQYDLTTISNTSNAFGYRVDDYGSTIGTASALTLSNGAFTAAGVVEKNTDADYFGVTTTGPSTLTVNLAVAQYGAMLDGSLYVYDAQGNLLASADTSSLGESLTVSLSAAGSYYVSVTSHGGYGDIGQYTLSGSVAVQAPQPPVVVTVNDPGTPTVTPVSAGEVVVGWADNSDNETGFVIQRSTDNGSTWTTLTSVGAGVTSYHDTTVAGGTTYKYRVQAYSNDVASNYTAGVSGTTVPTAPASLTPTAVSASQITLTWGDVVGETSYSVERSLDGTTWTQIGTTGANVTTYVDSGLSSGTSYSYRVRAIDGTGPSTYSSSAAVITAPATPGSVAAVANSATQVTVSWGDVVGETSFIIERSPDGTSGWTQVGTTQAGVTTFVDGGRSAGTRYYYRVRAGNAWGMSVYSGTVNALTVPGAPGVPVVTPGSGTQVSVNWSAVTGAATYVVERSTDNSSWQTLTTTGMTTVADMTVSAGTWYYYRVRAVNASGSSGAGTSAGALTRPDAPSSVAATANSATKVTVTWSAVVGADAYTVERSADGVTGWTSVATGVAGRSYLDEGLTAETPYYYRVRATNASGASGPTTVASATTLEVAVVVIDPGLLTAVPDGPAQISISWQDNSNNEDGFVVERTADGGTTWVTVVTTEPGVTSYEDTGLIPGTTYGYRVQAYSGDVTSAFAGTVSATTAPAAPANLWLTVASTNGITLNWTAVTGADGYEVERSANGTSGWTNVATTGGDVTSYVNTGLSAGTRYYYRVRATSTSGGSDYTFVANTVTLPAAPVSVVAKAYVSGQLSIAWTAVTGATGYELQRSADGVSGWQTVATTGAGLTAATQGDLAANTQYFYRVRAMDEAGGSAFSAVTSGLTFAPAPATPTASAAGSGQIKMEWLAVAGTTGYVVERSADGGSTWSSVASLDGSAATSYTDGGLAASTTYAYRVRSVNAAGASDASGVVSATTAEVVPVAPASLTATQLSATNVQLAWLDRSDNEAGFKVEYSTNGKTWKLAGNVPANTTAVQVTGLVAGQAYQFRVSAYNQMGFSGFTNTANAKLAKALVSRGVSSGVKPAPIVLDIRKVKNVYPGLTKSLMPDAATDLVATPYSTSAVQLTWTDNSETELGFRVEYSLNGRVWLLAGYVGADQTGCRVTGLVKGKAYTFRVSAYNMAGVTTKSATDKATMPKVNPTGPAARPSSDADQDTVLNVLKVKTVAPGLPGDLKVA